MSVSPVELLMRVIDRSWNVVRHLVRGHVDDLSGQWWTSRPDVPGVPMLLLDDVGR